MRAYSNWKLHSDEVFVKIDGEPTIFGEPLITKAWCWNPLLPNAVIVTERLRSYGAAMKVIGNVDKQETGRWLYNRAENSHLPFRR